MKIKPYYLLMSLVLMLVSACSDDKDPTPTPPEIGEERTVLVYWVGDNAKGDLSYYAMSDFNEMVEGMAGVDASKYNLLVYSELKNDVPHLIHVSKVSGKVVADTIKTYEEQNPLDKTVMSGVISKVVSEYPAKSYGLVMASHADGWMEASSSANSTRHFGDYRGTQLNITDLREVLEDAPHLEFILFDACYMQTIEVAYELRNCADYIIGSPSEIPGPGAPYQKVVPFFFHSSDPAGNIASAYYDYYGNADGTIRTDAAYTLAGVKKNWIYGVSVSVLNISKIDALAGATERILSQYVPNKTPVSTSGLYYYSYSDGNGSAWYYDMDAVINEVTGGNADYDNWRDLFDVAQPYFKTTKTNFVNRMGKEDYSMEGAHGVSMYVPTNASSNAHKFYQTLQLYTNGNVWKSSGW